MRRGSPSPARPSVPVCSRCSSWSAARASPDASMRCCMAAKPKRTASPGASPVLSMRANDVAKARRHLMRRDPRLRELIKRIGPCELGNGRGRDPFVALVRAILSQQLSGKAADTIYGRVAALAKPLGGLSATAILAIEPTALRGAGVSGPKISYLRDLASRV